MDYFLPTINSGFQRGDASSAEDAPHEDAAMRRASPVPHKGRKEGRKKGRKEGRREGRRERKEGEKEGRDGRKEGRKEEGKEGAARGRPPKLRQRMRQSRGGAVSFEPRHHALLRDRQG